jgi:hypothetical protein
MRIAVSKKIICAITHATNYSVELMDIMNFPLNIHVEGRIQLTIKVWD